MKLLEELLDSEDPRLEAICSFVSGSAFPEKFQGKKSGDFPCLMPSVDVMNKFHETIEKMFEFLQKSSEGKIRFDTARDTLLARLMSGGTVTGEGE